MPAALILFALAVLGSPVGLIGEIAGGQGTVATPDKTDLAGIWEGSLTRNGKTETLELTLAREGSAWKASGRMTDAESGKLVTDMINDLKVGDDGAVSFACQVEGTDVKFTGNSTPGKISGKLIATANGAWKTDGQWTVERPAPSETTGKWAGTLTTTGKGGGKIELSVTREGEAWKAVGRLVDADSGEVKSDKIENFSVIGRQVRFTCKVDRAEVHFTGKRGDAKIEGTLKAFADGEERGGGEWSIEKVK
jgi:hypothetical protein